MDKYCFHKQKLGKLKMLVVDMQLAVMCLCSLSSRVSIISGVRFLTEVAVQLLPRDTHCVEHHWQPLVLAVQL